MKRGFYLLLAVAAVMALTTVSMVAAAKPEGKGKGPKAEATGPGATGRGSFVNSDTGTTVTISFEAGMDDTGHPYGKLKHTDRELGQRFAGTNICYTAVADNVAVFGGVITSSSGQWPPIGHHYLVKVVDNGAGKDATRLDQFGIEFHPSNGGVLLEGGICQDPVGATLYNLVKGGIEVTPSP